MGYKHDTTRRFESETFSGVTIILKKMTEGRRISLRELIGEPNRRIREIMREQAVLEKAPDDTRDTAKWLELQDEFDGIMIGTINPSWIKWGVKQIEGLEVDGKSLGVEDWEDWPSALFDEVLTTVKSEAELNGAERKNSELLTTSGELEALIQRASTAPPAGDAAGGEIRTVGSITPIS